MLPAHSRFQSCNKLWLCKKKIIDDARCVKKRTALLQYVVPDDQLLLVLDYERFQYNTLLRAVEKHLCEVKKTLFSTTARLNAR